MPGVRDIMQEMLEMTDIAFELKGHSVPAGHAFALWREVARILPWLEAEKFAGIHQLRIAASGEEMLLPQRAKLVLRLPAARVSQAGRLSGQELHVGSSVLSVGAAKERALKAFPTLHAQLVESDGEEDVFIAHVIEQLGEMKISCKWICGKHHKVIGAERTIAGYSLVLHDLKPDESLNLQRYGLGGERHFGCGIFVPYKTISGLG